VALTTVQGRDIIEGDLTLTRWRDYQRVVDIVDTPDEVARVTDVRARRAVLLWSETYGETVGWRGLPDGLSVTVDRVTLSCGHWTSVPGPAGAPTGRCWCETCGESSAIVDGATL
jgi:hypothetical protein